MKVSILQDPDTRKWIMTLTMPHVERQFILYLGTDDMARLHGALTLWWDREHHKEIDPDSQSGLAARVKDEVRTEQESGLSAQSSHFA